MFCWIRGDEMESRRWQRLNINMACQTIFVWCSPVVFLGEMLPLIKKQQHYFHGLLDDQSAKWI